MHVMTNGQESQEYLLPSHMARVQTCECTSAKKTFPRRRLLSYTRTQLPIRTSQNCKYNEAPTWCLPFILKYRNLITTQHGCTFLFIVGNYPHISSSSPRKGCLLLIVRMVKWTNDQWKTFFSSLLVPLFFFN